MMSFVLLSTLAPSVASCQTSDEKKSLSGEITISAAASLTDAFTELGKHFESRNSGAKVRFNFGSSATLIAQIKSGAPSDVIVSADMASIGALSRAGKVIADPKIFAENTMAIAVRPGNPMNVTTVADLGKLRFVSLCSKSVPCGAYASTVLANAGLLLSESKITRGIDVKSALSAVSTGDADAAIVYKTDIIAAGKSVVGIAIPPAQNVKAIYGIAPIRGSKNSLVASAFIDFVLSVQGWQILKSFGFQR